MGKLKSRKFWIAVAVTAYFALMAIRELDFETPMATIVCSACAALVTFGYLIVEGLADKAGASGDIYIDVDDDEEEVG